MVSFTSSYTTLNLIYARNPLSFNLSPKNYSTKDSLAFTAPILLILFLSILLLSINQLTISYNCLIVTSYKLVSFILISLLNLKVVAAVDGIVISALGSVLFDFAYIITK